MASRKKNTEIEEKPKSGIMRHVWLGITMAFVLVTGYVIVRNLIVIAGYRIKISRLRSEKAEYQRRISADSLLIEQLKYDDFLEKYARERYRMHRPDEDVFLTD